MSRPCADSLMHSTRAGTYDGREGPRRDGSLNITFSLVRFVVNLDT